VKFTAKRVNIIILAFLSGKKKLKLIFHLKKEPSWPNKIQLIEINFKGP